jgi:DNA repair exonuclease SbcCD ATPase subunit
MILFQKIRWKNFLSTGAHFTEINFTKSNNTLIIGHNGAGKSTVLDALCFGLFGKPFRKINKPQLVNSINTKDCVVEVFFNIGQKQYKIVRGIKPNTFEIHINDVLLNQDAAAKDYQEILEKQILKLNYKSFTQVVILGSASFVPFMQLSANDRRTIIEDLLDIQIFSSMNSVVKEKLSEFKEDITKAKYGISLTEEKINLQLQNIEEHKKHNDDEIAKILAEIGKSKEQHNKLRNDIELINKHVTVLNSKIGNKKEKLEKKSKGLFQVKGKIENNIKKNEKDIEFYQHNDNCPTCKQSIESQFKEQQVEERTNKLNTQKTGLTEVETELENITNEMSEITKIIQHIIEHQNQVTEHNATVRAISTYIDKLNKQYDELSVKVNSPQTDNQKLLELKSEMFEFNAAYEELMNEKTLL